MKDSKKQDEFSSKACSCTAHGSRIRKQTLENKASVLRRQITWQTSDLGLEKAFQMEHAQYVSKHLVYKHSLAA